MQQAIGSFSVFDGAASISDAFISLRWMQVPHSESPIFKLPF